MDFTVRIIQPAAEPQVVEQVAALLTSSTEDFKESRGGHVPDDIVEGIIHKQYTSRESILETFSQSACRFIITPRGRGSEVLGTLLVARSCETILVKDSRSLNASTREHLGLAPANHHCGFNFAVRKDVRRQGVASALLRAVSTGFREQLRGEGLWLRAEPPFHDAFLKLGFVHHPERDQFFEPGVRLPAGYSSPWQFNERYVCRCAGAEPGRLRERKLKYGIYTLSFR